MARSKSPFNRPSTDQIEYLQKKAPQCLSIFEQIREKDNGVRVFADWLKLEYPNIKGLGYTSITQLVNLLLEIKEKLKDRTDELTFTDASFGTLKRKIEDISEKASLYLKKPQFETVWYVYFLHIAVTEFDFSHSAPDPELGRAVLKLSSDREAKLENISDGISYDYEGIFEYINQEVFHFDLKTDAKKSRRLHIKFYWQGVEQTIALGTYSTFENDRIVSGNLVLQSVEAGKKKLPLLMSFKKNRNDFKNVHPAIKEYLCLRNLNYHRISKEVTSVSLLAKELKHLQINKPQNSIFLEPHDRPTVFIASPDTADSIDVIRGRILGSVLANLQKNFGDYYNIVHRNTNISPQYDKDLLPSDSLKLIKTARVFIVIISKSDKASFCWVQLGWAIAYAKRILVLYEEGGISDRIKNLREFGIVIDKFNTLQSQTITNKISAILAYDKNYLT